MSQCQICFGKGEWPAISDREWQAHGGRRGCDYTQRCGFCRGAGEVKPYRLAAPVQPDSEPADADAEGGANPVSKGGPQCS